MTDAYYLIRCRTTGAQLKKTCTPGTWYAHLNPQGVGRVGKYIGGTVFCNSEGNFNNPAGASLSVQKLDVQKSNEKLAI